MHMAGLLYISRNGKSRKALPVQIFIFPLSAPPGARSQTVGADAHIGPLGIDANRTPIDRTQACEPVGAACMAARAAVRCPMRPRRTHRASRVSAQPQQPSGLEHNAPGSGRPYRPPLRQNSEKIRIIPTNPVGADCISAPAQPKQPPGPEHFAPGSGRPYRPPQRVEKVFSPRCAYFQTFEKV